MLGIKCKSYVSIGNTFIEVKDISEETVSLKWNTEDVLVRRQQVAGVVPTSMQPEHSLKVLTDPTDAAWAYLNKSFINGTTVEFLFLSDGAASLANGALDTGNISNSTVGERWTGYVTEFSKSRGAGDVLYNDVAARPAPAANLTFFSKANGTISYSAIGNYT